MDVRHLEVLGKHDQNLQSNMQFTMLPVKTEKNKLLCKITHFILGLFVNSGLRGIFCLSALNAPIAGAKCVQSSTADVKIGRGFPNLRAVT